MKPTFLIVTLPVIALVLSCGTTEKISPVAGEKAAYDAYLKSHASDYDWFAHASDAYGGGIPLILLRSLPDLAPDIFGKPEEQFSRFGFLPDPENTSAPLPLGLSWDSMDSAHPAQQFHPVALTCGACHIGRVRLDNGSYMTLVGAPNTQIDVRKWRKAFEQTAHQLLGTPADIAATADRLRTAIAAKPANYFYHSYRGVPDQVEAGERQAFLSTAGGKDVAAAILTAFGGKVLLGELATNKQKATSYGKSNAPPLDGGSPGQSDGSGDLIPRLLLLDTVMSLGPAKTFQSFAATSFPALPDHLATVTDILSTWEMADQHVAQVDGSVKSPVFRNVAASLAVAGDPSMVNIQNAGITAEFISRLPAPAYPFAIDAEMASRGKELFKTNCAGCHRPFNDNLYSVQQIGTDPNRSRVLNADALALFVKHFIASVPADYEITDASGAKIKLHDVSGDEVIVNRTQLANQGYVTNALNGAWARSPYLHNGSVPTLYHLLVPAERPAKFVRGAIGYDPEKVGYQWDAAKLDAYRAVDATASPFDTSWDSSSNGGHNQNLIIDSTGKILHVGWDGSPQSGETRVRLDWSGPDNKKALADLLEYLKTI